MRAVLQSERAEGMLLERWPALVAPRPAPVRALLAGMALRRVAKRSGVRMIFSDGRSLGPELGPVMRIADRRAFLTRLGRGGKIGFGESYMAGDWNSADLVGVLTAMARQVETLVPGWSQRLRRVYEARHPAEEDNHKEGAKRNIARHYDLSNELFATFLDRSMTYSSALFTTGSETLEDAQHAKVDRLLDAVGVTDGTRLLEIGTGWGELALRAAQRGAQVTTITLSEQQAHLARRRIAAEGMAQRVDVRVQDYRDVGGLFDAVISIEMMEAVGERWWPDYLHTLDQRLAPGGRVGLQVILMDHHRVEATKSSWTWIHKYIFPGGLIPSERAIDETLAAHTTLSTADRRHFADSYAQTLRLWRETFDRNGDRVADLGFDVIFRRMWRFYLAYSEAGFRSGYLTVAQLVLARPEG